MPNPLENAIASAVKASDFQKRMFGRMGNSEHPRGAVLSAYRNARRAMKQALAEIQPRNAAHEVMSELQRIVQVEMRDILQQASNGGFEEARRQLAYYGIEIQEAIETIELSEQIDRAEKLILDEVVQQTNLVDALIATGNSEMILGSEDTIGVLRPGDVLAAGAFWISASMWLAFSVATSRGKEKNMRKQAIAAIDNKTTDCCLRVHGQVVDLDGKFVLTGTPAYAGEMEWSPFHAWCRTSIALYLGEYDKDLTENMEGAAAKVLDERSHGVYKTRTPADAYG